MILKFMFLVGILAIYATIVRGAHINHESFESLIPSFDEFDFPVKKPELMKYPKAMLEFGCVLSNVCDCKRHIVEASCKYIEGHPNYRRSITTKCNP